MRVVVVLLICICSSIKVFGQTFAKQTFFFAKQTFFKENFDTDNGNWPFMDIKNSFYDARIVDGKYRFYLPEGEPNGFTWVGYPKELSGNFNSSNNISFEFDAEVSTDGWFRSPKSATSN